LAMKSKKGVPAKKGQPRESSPAIFSVGHSTRSLDQFLELLRAYGIKQVVDIRTLPRSRHNPQFNRETLSRFLRNRRIGYRHMKTLGGLRRARADSPNMGWQNASFRGFADYMQTPEFAKALEKFMDLTRLKPTVLMCAEAVPWRCHRSLVGDALTVRGFAVQDIFSPRNAKLHALTPMAKVRGTRLTYPD
jgi:uncharacterized protein (DUF488 family)